jgi:selenocysteine-specific elongation factor
MRAVVFGTAGHIDHGKTALVAALTGVDCDRLPEEKRRGITLVLGFAPLHDPLGEVEASFIDVPGHERLVHTMIAGAGGIDRALLVVAADEGVMPQTREHLDVLALLGVRAGVVALNKCDLVEAELLDVVEEELRDTLATSPLAGAPIVRCSATRREGIEALREAVLACARAVERQPATHRPFRLGVDRVFALPGTGTVVTGTARWGEVRVGDELVALPSGRVVRVRGVQVHNTPRERAVMGERVALQLAGVRVSELPRGEQLLSSGPWRATTRVAAAVQVLPGARPLEEGDEVWLHLLAGRSLARVERLTERRLEGGTQGRAILRLARALFAAPGDRVVLRTPSPPRTVGGGQIIDPWPSRIPRRAVASLAALPDAGQSPREAVDLWIREAGREGVEPRELAARLGWNEAGLEPLLGQLVTAGSVEVVPLRPPRLLAREVVRSVVEKARELLVAAGATGIPVPELLSRLLPPGAERLREHYLGALRAAGVVAEIAGRALAVERAAVEDPLAAAVEAFYRREGFSSPSPGEVAASLRANPKAVEGMVRFLLARGRLARVGGKWIVHRDLLDETAAAVRAWGVEVFDVGQFKERFSLTRKLAIPLLEWLDSQRVTRREGDRRRVLPPRAS